LDFSISPVPQHRVNAANYAYATIRMSLSSQNHPQYSQDKPGFVCDNNDNCDATDAAHTHSSNCGVCYDVLAKNSNRVYTVCGHLFCVRCILIWSNHDNSCPLCRRPLVNKDN
jgi:hypothetical protein